MVVTLYEFFVLTITPSKIKMETINRESPEYGKWKKVNIIQKALLRITSVQNLICKKFGKNSVLWMFGVPLRGTNMAARNQQKQSLKCVNLLLRLRKSQLSNIYSNNTAMFLTHIRAFPASNILLNQKFVWIKLFSCCNIIPYESRKSKESILPQVWILVTSDEKREYHFWGIKGESESCTFYLIKTCITNWKKCKKTKESILCW